MLVLLLTYLLLTKVFLINNIVAVCPEINTTGLINPPVIEPSGNIPYKGKIRMNCTVPGRMSFVRERSCRYDAKKDTYRLIGDELECGGNHLYSTFITDLLCRFCHFRFVSILK